MRFSLFAAAKFYLAEYIYIIIHGVRGEGH